MLGFFCVIMNHIFTWITCESDLSDQRKLVECIKKQRKLVECIKKQRKLVECIKILNLNKSSKKVIIRDFTLDWLLNDVSHDSLQ